MPKPAFSSSSIAAVSVDSNTASVGDTLTALPKDVLMMRSVDGSAETVFRSEDVAGTTYDFVEITLNNPTAVGQVVEVGIIGANLWINALIKNNTDPAVNGPAGHALLNGANDTTMWVRFFCESVADGWSVGMMGSLVVDSGSSEPDLLEPITRTGAYAVDVVDYGKRVSIDTVPTFPAITAEHIGKWWALRNDSGADMTIPVAANLDMDLGTFGPKQVIFVHCVAVNMYEITGASS